MQEVAVADDESSERVRVTPGTDPAPTPDRPGDFERYGLLAAVTLVVLCLLLADRLRPSARRPDLPPPDRLVRVEIGGVEERPRPPRRAVAPRPVERVPAREPPPAPEPEPEPEPARTHVVRPGETLSSIARAALGSSRRVDEIASLNGIEDPDSIRAGQELRLPPR